MLKKNIVLCGALAVLAGCSSSYKYSELQTTEVKLDPTVGVLISPPENGWYDQIEYRNSGRMTAKAIQNAFAKNTSNVDVTHSCIGDECLNTIDSEKYGYYAKPVILGWEDRATEWSGKPDKIEIQIVIFDVKTETELVNLTFSGKSKWLTFGGYHPQDLLEKPTNQYINSLYH
ncbi:MAG: DUF4823 domain-containing protein [Moritella sp.]|uniref:DUF4823 domain-containing protein n=1 Tax=Moritella sp. TaxID=78556 RepID=UPI0029BA7E7F|nr:DUF4823 domain-containing protein [Moritella sp.]MDX2321304.1 DUF4823 domain-containing protein [Moritella sp.]